MSYESIIFPKFFPRILGEFPTTMTLLFRNGLYVNFLKNIKIITNITENFTKFLVILKLPQIIKHGRIHMIELF